MAYKVIETESFIKSLSETFDYILINFKNLTIVNEMLNTIDGVSELLKLYPDMYAIFEPSYELEFTIRKFPVKDYFVFYIVRDDLEEVQLLKIIHSSRNIYQINYLKE